MKLLPEPYRTIALWALLPLCIAGWIVPQTSMDYRRSRWEEPESLLFLPTGEYLDATSLGYQNLLADGLYLWSIQYYGHHRTAEGRKYLWRIFDVITDLDPRFQDAYLTGALIMAVDMNDADLAIQLLEKGAANNSDDWIYPVEAGYYAWMNLEDYERAAEYFTSALERPGAPPTIERARAGLAEYAGDKRTALALWIEIYDEAVASGDERIESIAWQHVYDLKVDIDLELLRGAVRQFWNERGRPPRALGALVSQGFVTALPVRPDAQPYEYDRVTGRITDPRDGASRADR